MPVMWILHAAFEPAHREWHPHPNTRAQKLMKNRQVAPTDTIRIETF